MRKLWELVKTAFERVLKLRMVAWSPPLVVAVILWWVVKDWRKRRKGRHHPAQLGS